MVREPDAFAASGTGGYFVFATPALDVVVVMTSLPLASDPAGTTLRELVPLARASRQPSRDPLLSGTNALRGTPVMFAEPGSEAFQAAWTPDEAGAE